MVWFFSRLFRSSPKGGTDLRTKRRPLKLETLEERAVPAILHVTNMTSDNPATVGTLRHEIVNSAANDTIVIDVAGTLTLTNGALNPTHNLTIKGLGPTNDVIKAGAGTNLIFSDYSAPLTLSGLTLTGAHTNSDGGAISSSGGLLTIDNCIISGNTSTGDGAGINANSGLTITNSIVSGLSPSNRTTASRRLRNSGLNARSTA